METRLARIEEIVKRTDRAMGEIQKLVPQLHTEIELLKRDVKWHKTIGSIAGALFGAFAGFIFEVFRK